MKKALQLYYTSCKKGLSSGSGFQTFSMSEGISNEERLEIEHYGLYVAPLDMPSQPSMEEVATMFPTSFSFFRLRTGRFGVARSKYVGKDYSGRFGNYFVHALILNDGLFPFHPIRLFGSSIFRDGLTEQEMDVPQAPDPLPSLGIDDLALDGNLDQNIVREFVQNNHRGEVIEKIVAATLAFETSHRPLVFCDSWKNIPYWIGALQMALPVNMAHGITFNTYTADPETCNTLVCATSRTGSRFDFSEYQRDFQYYIFDFLDDSSSVVEEKSKYGLMASKGYSVSAGSLPAFHDFIEKFEFREINREIEAAYDLFEITNAGVKALSLDNIVCAIKFANDYAPSPLLGALAEKIADIVDTISHEVDVPAAHVITEFLFKISAQTKKAVHLDTAYAFFFNCLDHLIFDSDEVTFDGIDDLNSMALMINRHNSKNFVSRWIAPERLHRLSKYITDDETPSHARACFVLTINNLTAIDATWPMVAKSPEFLSFIDVCLDRMISSKEELFQAFSRLSMGDDRLNAPFFANLMGRAVEAAKRAPSTHEDLVFCFTNTIREKSSDWALSIRKSLVNLGYGELIFGEFLLLLRNSKDVSGWFWEYYKAIFVPINEYYDVYFEKAVGIFVETYLSKLPPKKRGAECARLLGYTDSIHEKSVIDKIVRDFEGTLSLEPPSQELLSAIDKSKQLKRKFDIRTHPDISGLILFAVRLQDILDEAGPMPDAFEDDFLPVLQGIDAKSYERYLRWIIPVALALMESSKDHSTFLGTLKTELFYPELADNYMRCFDHFLKKLKNKNRAFEALWNFMAFYLQTDQETKNASTKAIQELMEKRVIDLLSRQPKDALKKMDAIVKAAKPGAGLSKKRWNSIHEEAKTAPENSIFSLFSTFLKKMRIT